MFFKSIHTRIKIIILITIFLFIVIMGKVFYIQVIDYKKLNGYATSLWSRNLPLAASLEEKIVDLDKDSFFDGGSITVGGATLQCWKHGGHGQETYLEVVENSCNLVCKLEKLVAILKFISLFVLTKLHY